MGRSSLYVCQTCGAQTRQFFGRCAACGSWNSLVEQVVPASDSRRRRPVASPAAAAGAAGEELAVVVRPRRGRYLASRTNAWEDPLEHFAASAHLYLPEDAYAEEIRIALPYAAFPEGSGGSIDLEVAVHGPNLLGCAQLNLEALGFDHDLGHK